MTTGKVNTALQTTLHVLELLIPVATAVTANIAGVPVPVTAGLAVVQALMPITDQFILEINGRKVAIDTSQANDPKAIIAALDAEAREGWPALTFAP
jgi:hypothetical protein